MTDEQLVGQILQKDEAAFAELYERYRRKIFAIGYKVLGNEADALDMVQEVFLKLHRTIHLWDPERASFSAWLARLALNESIDRWRYRKRRTTEDIDETIGLLEDSRLDSPLEISRGSELRQIVLTELEKLPDLQRKVFLLRHFEGYQLHEIAAVTQHALGTVKTSLFRGTQTLRKRLKKYGYA